MLRMLSVSFYRPMEYFSGTLNKFVTWMTDGEFCHCDLVIHTTPAEVMEVAREAVKQLSADGVIPDLLAEHCKSAACSARDTVLQALDECREDAEEFTEEVQQRAEQRATGKRGGKKR
mgnify:CR=1 FL=1